MKIFVYHTPEETPIENMPDCAIAVDVLRATTTIATAINTGAEGVQVFSNIEELMTVSDKWPAEQRIRVGERGGKKVEGCDEGNSPLNFTSETVKGKRLFMTTTNGTRCL
ncbi:MAG: 2-phosphosulfolactate phosphatase, partial [Trichodesmium sp. MAG_R04]|nr:2-phosphosulfolactate phosphatase [Trichodesmium sp. MAG_R04]